MSSRCFPLLVVNIKLLNNAIGPKLTSLISLPFAYLELSTLLTNSLNQDNYLAKK